MAVPQGPREDTQTKKFIPWEVFYMSVAALESQRSNCEAPDQVGACIVSPTKKIVAVGHSCLEKTNTADCEHLEDGLNIAYNFVSHAAISAILNKHAESVNGCKIYITRCPSNEEAKVIIQAGITEVIYLHKDMSGSCAIYKCDKAEKLFINAKVWLTWYGDLPIQSFGFEHCHPNLKLDVFPIPDPPEEYPQPLFGPPSDMDFFMAMACLASLRSKDTKRKVGACIVKDKTIVSFGYNGFPINISDHDPRTTWKSASEARAQQREGEETVDKHLFVVHAEVNSIMYKNCVDLKGCVLYTTLFPCLECAKVIIRSGIKKIYYLTDYLYRTGDKEWNDPQFDDDWRERGDKETYVASRCLLKDHFRSTDLQAGDADLRIIEQYTPTKVSIDIKAERLVPA